MEKVKSPDGLIAWRRQTDESVAVVTGSFDILQPGNLEVLQQAGMLAKRVVVVIEPDDVVAAHSSKGRPQNRLETRVEMVSFLRYVDVVTSLPLADANAVFTGLKPFIWVTAKTQKVSEAYSESILSAAERVVEVAPLEGCFTEDIIAAIAANRTPVKVPAMTREGFRNPTGGPPAWPARPLALQRCDADVPNILTERPEIKPVPSMTGLRGLVTVNGCFDILHIGHLRFLREARALGGSLTVLINSDGSVARYKGATRPVFPEAFRIAALKALDCVGGVLVFTGDNPLDEIRQLQPQTHVKGGSYEPERVRAERELVESWGGRLVCTAMVEGFSTTDYIRKALGNKA